MPKLDNAPKASMKELVLHPRREGHNQIAINVVDAKGFECAIMIRMVPYCRCDSIIQVQVFQIITCMHSFVHHVNFASV